MASQFADLGEHVGTLVAIIAVILTVCGALITAIYKIVFRLGETLKDDIFEMLKGLDGKISELWTAIGQIRDRQVALREGLPKEYMRLEGPGYRAVIEGLDRIETHFEQFADDCRSGKCGGKK